MTLARFVAVLLNVNAIMFYSIFNLKKAIYEVEDLQGALSNTAQTQVTKRRLFC